VAAVEGAGVNMGRLERRKQVMDASASCEVIWDMEGQALDFDHCLRAMRDSIAEQRPDCAARRMKELRDRAAQLLKSCDELEERIQLGQLLSKCPE